MVLAAGLAVHGLAQDLILRVEQDLAGEGWGLAAAEADGVVEVAEVAEGDGGGGAGQIGGRVGKGLRDKGKAGPVEVDVAEVGALGG